MGQYTPNNIITELNRIQAAETSCEQAVKSLLEYSIGDTKMEFMSPMTACISEKGSILGIPDSNPSIDSLICAVYDDYYLRYMIMKYNKSTKRWTTPQTGTQYTLLSDILLDWIEIDGVKQYYSGTKVPVLEQGITLKWLDIATLQHSPISGTVTDYLKLTR